MQIFFKKSVHTGIPAVGETKKNRIGIPLSERLIFDVNGFRAVSLRCARLYCYLLWYCTFHLYSIAWSHPIHFCSCSRYIESCKCVFGPEWLDWSRDGDIQVGDKFYRVTLCELGVIEIGIFGLFGVDLFLRCIMVSRVIASNSISTCLLRRNGAAVKSRVCL